ncbi:HET-domain-containing protein [Cenococcum geophilum 1.58]|uniref:HET-domain-containing protein n=1 Tax=Cenococcum geophilum 1.58 TaxID=794803 RepID=UPI00358FAC10|nr:HET-domain-containing protein [Cenococcum geophilum 1.58]
MAFVGQYQYLPLKDQGEVRLLHLKPGRQQDNIRVSIIHAQLDDQPIYQALSYTWGDATVTTPIACSEVGNTLPITRNCEAALRRLRLEGEERVLWVDAICIDQRNVQERNSQVRLMPAIYRQAKRVLAYLGEKTSDSDLGMEFILEDSRWPSDRPTRPSVGLGPGITSSPQQMAVDNILKRPYFERIWILQEIELARDIWIVLGDKEIDWESFSRTVFYVDTNKKLNFGSSYRSVLPTVVFYRDKSTVNKPETLLQFLNDTRQCKSTDPCDKVFALLNMSTERDEPALAPNYGLSPKEVFTSAARFFITRDKNLDVLCHAQAAPSAYNVPSWVTDWSMPRVSRVLGQPKTSPRPLKADRSEILASIGFGEDFETLVVKGRAFDIVCQVGLEYCTGRDVSTTVRQWEGMLQSVHRYPSAADLKNAFMDTLIAYPPYKGLNRFSIFYPAWRSAMFDEPFESSDSNSEGARALFQEHVNKACNARRFFVTAKGYIGLGPPEVQDGNLVTVLLGGQVPFILSKQEKFRLVGECYVHGLMDGEAFSEDGVEIDEFHIK